MNKESTGKLSGYYREAETWAQDREHSRFRSQKIAWTIAATASAVALFEAIALIALTPLKTVVPYTLLVDRQTGYVQALKPFESGTVAPDTALTKSLLAQYVITREGFNIDSLREEYRRVALWSEGEARTRYIAGMLASNPSSPLANLPRRTLVQVDIVSITPLSNDTALVRFVTTRTEPGGQPQTLQPWASTIKYHFSNAEMTEAAIIAVLKSPRQIPLMASLQPLGIVVTCFLHRGCRLNHEAIFGDFTGRSESVLHISRSCRRD